MSNLENQLWASADILRGKMHASEYRNYLLGLIFYKYLSDQQLRVMWLEEFGKDAELPSRLEQYNNLLEWFQVDPVDLAELTTKRLGYFITPENLFGTLRHKASNYELQLSDLQNAFNELGRQGDQFVGLFDDIDLRSNKLGATDQQRNITMTEAIKALDEIDLFGHAGDVIGDAYEYLIAQFAAGAGQKAGEFYTPQAVSRIISEIAAIGQKHKTPFTIYDPTMGSGSLMLHIRDFLDNPNTVKYAGQELNTTTYNLGRMNLILHGVGKENMNLRNADTLDEDWPSDDPWVFNAVVMNPPYSANWSADAKFLSDPRFEKYGKLAPKSKADFAFLLHGLYHLEDDGTMGIVLPHGVLFRGAAEGIIRKKLLEDGAIDAVIGLPANIFYGTSIPTVVLILKKNRESRDVLFIDASKGFEKRKNQNVLRDSDIDAIVDAYKNRSEIDKFAHVAAWDEIVGNDFNLNIPRYVSTFEPEPEIDIAGVYAEIEATDAEIARLQTEFEAMVAQLVPTIPRAVA